MVLLLRVEANEYAVSIRTDLAAGPPKITDRVQLELVLMNLMLNGIEAMKEMGGVLRAKTETRRMRTSTDLRQRHRSRIAGRNSGRDLQYHLHH
jgi:signal transduction histidine kinase